MKKVTLILSALALVLGLSQCKKQEEPVQSGEKQHIVLTANNGNDGSKVAASFASAALNLTWEGNETIAVSGGASGTLTYKSGVGTPNATFEGDITIDRGGDIVFTIGSAPKDEDFADQAGTADACATLINANNHFVGTSSYQPSGSYEVQMRLQYAVLKLDVSALGTTGAMTIAANGATVASVTDVASSEGKAVFVAVPTDETEKAYTITCGGKTATKTWTLEKNVFYTKAGAEGAGTGEAIEIKPTPKFTVGENTTVEFAPGNLYYNGEDDDHKMNSNLPSGWNFYEHQWNCYPSGTSSVTESMEISLFTWGYGTWSKVYNTTTYQTGSGVTMTDWGSLAIGGYEANTWRTLSRAEWDYLLNSRDDASSLRAWKDFGNNVKGLVILPDDTDASVMESITSTEALATHGAVFLPAAGRRYGTDVNSVGSSGDYWSGTPYEDDEDGAYDVYFGSGNVGVGNDSRSYGSAVRLVR